MILCGVGVNIFLEKTVMGETNYSLGLAQTFTIGQKG